MEKKLTKQEVLRNLLKQASNPLISMERKLDVRRILETSNTMDGVNHLFLLECYFTEDLPLFTLSYEEAMKQAYLAIQEKNTGAYFYLYKLWKDSKPSWARNYLRLSADEGYAKAYLELGKLKHRGILFEQDRKQAFECYRMAALGGLKDGYFGMLLMASEDKNPTLEKEIYVQAKIRGFSLPGVVE